MATKNKQRVTVTSKPAPESLKLDQRRYLTKRLDSVFNPIIQELVSKVRDARYPLVRMTILQDALLLVQRDRQLIADKILLFRDSTAIGDLDRCAATDYFKEAETAYKAKQKQLTAGGDL